MNKHTVPRSEAALNGIMTWERRAEALKLMRVMAQENPDRRKLLPQAVAILVGRYDPGEYTDTLLDLIERVAELEIDAGWAKYGQRSRAEHEARLAGEPTK